MGQSYKVRHRHGREFRNFSKKTKISRDGLVNNKFDDTFTYADIMDYEMFKNTKGSTNDAEIAKLKTVLTKMLTNSKILTERQKQCIILNKLQCINQKDIAKELGINPSTVCRHIKFGMEKLKRIGELYK